MEPRKLGAVESRFADLIWQHAPIGSGALVQLCQSELGWKKSTTYTVLKKLCDRGIFVNDGGTVRARMSKAEFSAMQSEQFVEETFGGSLPAFLAAFTARKPLSAQELAEIRRMLDEYGG